MDYVQVHPKEFSLDGFPYYFSVAIYCFEGAGMILSLEQVNGCGLWSYLLLHIPQSLASEVRSQFKSYFVTTILAITTLYITFGAAGYLSYGPATRSVRSLMLSSLPQSADLLTCVFAVFPV